MTILPKKKQWLSPSQSASASPKPDIHRKKVTLSVWWDNIPKQTINDVRYSQQLRRLNEKILEKRS